MLHCSVKSIFPVGVLTADMDFIENQYQGIAEAEILDKFDLRKNFPKTSNQKNKYITLPLFCPPTFLIIFVQSLKSSQISLVVM